MTIDLNQLSQLAPIFRELFKGYHVSRRDAELYSQLSNQQDQYRALFKALGFELVCDTRGFYYFVPEQMGAQVNIMRRLTHLGFALDDNGIYRFLPPMHRFLDVCLSVQQDRDLAASLHSALPLPTPQLLDDDSGEEIIAIDNTEEETEEQAMARAIAEEQELDA